MRGLIQAATRKSTLGGNLELKRGGTTSDYLRQLVVLMLVPEQTERRSNPSGVDLFEFPMAYFVSMNK